jgi:hypothetical protein
MTTGNETDSGWSELMLTYLGWTDSILLLGVLVLGVIIKRPSLMVVSAVAWSLIITFLRNPYIIFAPAAAASWFLGHAIGSMIATTLVFVIADTIRKYRASRRESSGDPRS